MASLFHLHSHGNRLKTCHTAGQFSGRQAQFQGYHSTGYRVGYRSIVNKRYGIFFFVPLSIHVCYGGRCVTFCHISNKHRCFFIGHRIVKRLAFVCTFCHRTAYQLVIGIVNDGFSIMEKHGLFATFFFLRRKVFLMGSTYIRKHGDGRLYDVAQSLHFSRLAYTRLKNAHLGLFVHQPY